jgi:Holliday junction resolvase
MMTKKKYIIENLLNWLEEKGMVSAPQPESIGGLHPDLVMHNNNKLLIAEVKVADVYRSKVFPALVGDMILRAQSIGSDAEFMAALLLKKINNKAIRDLEQYADNFMPRLNWFLLDESGRGIAVLKGELSDISVAPREAPQNNKFSPAIRGGLFSPSAKRMLKNLLLPGINPSYWGGSPKMPQGIVELAEMSEVSQPVVSSLVKRFEKAGYIKRINGVPKIIRHQELLDDWFYAVKHDNESQYPVRSLYGESVKDIIEKIRLRYIQNNNQSAVIGHHMACHLHNIGRSSIKSSYIYTKQPISEIMNDLDLAVDNSQSPALWIVQRNIESVFQGAVIINNLPVCDILQCYLDVRSSQARGQEQADYIMDNILIPQFRSMR